MLGGNIHRIAILIAHQTEHVELIDEGKKTCQIDLSQPIPTHDAFISNCKRY